MELQSFRLNVKGQMTSGEWCVSNAGGTQTHLPPVPLPHPHPSLSPLPSRPPPDGPLPLRLRLGPVPLRLRTHYCLLKRLRWRRCSFEGDAGDAARVRGLRDGGGDVHPPHRPLHRWGEPKVALEDTLQILDRLVVVVCISNCGFDKVPRGRPQRCLGFVIIPRIDAHDFGA